VNSICEATMQPLRTLAEIRADILALEKETEGLLAGIIFEVTEAEVLPISHWGLMLCFTEIVRLCP